MSVQSKEQILVLLREHETEPRRFGVKRCGIFGSFVRDEEREQSDVDILVEFDPERKTFDNFMNLASYLEGLFGRRVDLVTKESLSPHIGPHILREVEYAAFGA
jgi:predicted nucleotidyltransferase